MSIIIKSNCLKNDPPGFFSNFIYTLDWVHNSIYTNEEIVVDWSCGYEYNLWDYLFENLPFNDKKKRNIEVNNLRSYYLKNIDLENINTKINLYNKYDGWFTNNPNIFRDEEFPQLRDEFYKSFKSIKIKNFIHEKIHDYEKLFNNTLGVTVRIPRHYSLGNPNGSTIDSKISPEKFYQILCEETINFYEKEKFDSVFVCCDVEYFINLLKNSLGEKKVIYTKYNRLKSLNSDWKSKNLPLHLEYENILIDALLLSKTSYILGGSSNILLNTLFMNNKVPYKLFDLLLNLYGK